MVQSPKVFELPPDVRYRAVGGEGVVVRQAEAEVIVLNRLGIRVLEEIDAARPVSVIVETLLQQFAVERETLERDLGAYLDELLAAGVIAERAA